MDAPPSSPSDGTNVPPSNRRYVALVSLLFLLAVVIRVTGAWLYRHSLHPDFGIVALMAKHMAEGRDVPVFFYGQAYMGSLEPMISALLCRGFGLSGFAVSLGTVFCGLFILPVVYLWTRDFAGRPAAAAALAFCVVGPEIFFDYTIMPRGGYALTLLLSSTILWLTSRLVVREIEGRPAPSAHVLLLGVLAGLGWWTNQLITATLLTAACALLLALRGGLFRRAVVPLGLAGFIVGSLPWWHWNMTNDWGSFRFMRTFGRVPFGHGLSTFFGDRMAGVLGIMELPNWAMVLAALLFLCVAVECLGLLRKPASAQPRRERVYFGVILLFIAISAVVFAVTHFARFGTPRYLLPLVPPIAVAVGYAVAAWWKHGPRPLAVVVLACLIAAHAYGPIEMLRLYRDERAQADATFLTRLIDKHRITALFGDYTCHGLNFALREKVPVADIRAERYPAYARQAEIQDRVAILNDYASISTFLKWGGGSARTIRRSKRRVERVDLEFQPPAHGMEEAAPALYRIIDHRGADVSRLVTDRNLDTAWSASLQESVRGRLELEFSKPLAPSALRMVSWKRTGYPERWQLDGRTPDGKWMRLARALGASGYFWSGPRPHWQGSFHRMECRFPPAPLTALRFSWLGSPRAWEWAVSEIQVFTPTVENPPAELEREAALIDALQELGIQRLYSDRWVANAVHRDTNGSLATSREPLVFGDEAGLPLAPLVLTPETGLLVRREDTPACREVLASRRLRMTERDVAPWVLFHFAPETWSPSYGQDVALQWKGFGPSKVANRRWAYRLLDLARESRARGGEESEVVDLLEEALRLHPRLAGACAELEAIHRERGDSAAAEAMRRQFLASTPQTPAHAVWSNGAELAGLTTPASPLQPGQTLDITYYWTVPPDLRPHRYVMFVHFTQDGRIRFQDDFALLAGVPVKEIEQQGPDDLFSETRTIRLPADLAAGTYGMRAGLVDPRTEKRLRMSTALPSRKGTVTLPYTPTVQTDPR